MRVAFCSDSVANRSTGSWYNADLAEEILTNPTALAAG